MNKKKVEIELDVPEIQSAGPPPAAHADRVVAEMLHLLAKVHGIVVSNLRNFFKTVRDGNPRAQLKLVDQIKRIGYPLVLDVELQTGKRGKYSMQIFLIGCFDPVQKQLIMENDVIPEKPWLSFSCILHESHGHGVYDQSPYTLVYVTHHALSRLTQRCGARTVDDLLQAVADMCLAYFDRTEEQKEFVDGTRLPFKGGVAVLNHYDSEKKVVAVVVTVLDQQDPQGGA